MNEIEKLYENANIKICKRKQGFTLKDCTDRDCKECGYYGMPPFNAEKQIGLIKWLIIEGYIEDMLTVQISEENFEACLADTFNELWQDLTEEERTQIKEILE